MQINDKFDKYIYWHNHWILIVEFKKLNLKIKINILWVKLSELI
jgi:hypothetical protein